MTYRNVDGEPTELDTLCRTEPEWAASRLRAARAEHELMCAAADAWVSNPLRGVGPFTDGSLLASLDAIELATRASPLRKVKL